jgi:putative cardiolipin synthase
MDNRRAGTSMVTNVGSRVRMPSATRGAPWILFLALLLVGCSTLQPVSRRPDAAPAPAVAPLWSELAGVRGEDWFHLLNDGNDALAWRLRVIDSATRSLDLQTFLWMPDASGLSVLCHLLASADRGVRVRLLLDDTFTIDEDHLLARVDAHPGIDVRIYNPFSRRFDSYALRELFNINEFSRTDHRMHNKLLVADNRAAILGGRNIADEYFGFHPEANFRDMEILLGGEIVAGTSDVFDAFWNSGWSFPLEQVGERDAADEDLAAFRRWLEAESPSCTMEDPAVSRSAWLGAAREAASGDALLLADEPAGERSIPDSTESAQLAAMLQAYIDEAESEIVVVTAYLIPTPELGEAIRRAASRGVRIRMLTNSLRSNNHTAAHSSYRGFIDDLLAEGIELHEVRAEAKDRDLYMVTPVADKHLALHAKLLLIDDRLTFIGSANLDPRSLKLNSEIGIMVDSKALNSRVRERVAVDFSRRNAWQVALLPDNRVVWVGDDMVLDTQPAETAFQRLEDWFFSLLPIANEM